jgi:hypothetical protein
MRVEYVYLKDVDPDSLWGITAPNWNRPYGALLLDGDWQTMPSLPTPSWTEESGETEQGVRYRHRIRLRNMETHPSASAVLGALARRRLLLRITNRAGQRWVCGNAEQGWSLGYRRSSGGNGQSKGYQIDLQTETSQSAAGWEPFL